MRGLVGLVLAGVLMAGMADAAEGQISVTGEATVSVAPDMATISLGVTTQDATAGGAMRANSDALTAVLGRLTSAGIAKGDLQTENLQLNPNWTQSDGTTAPQISGYTASNMLSVRVRDLAILGKVLDAAIADGANTLNGVAFGQVDPRPTQDAARKAAVKDAMARAQMMAEAAGVKLGQIVSISESSGYGGPVMAMKAMDAGSVPTAAGEVGLTAAVSMVFDLDQ